MTNYKPQILITWVSGSWKSSIMNWLLAMYAEDFWKPIQYTTRAKRNDMEVDDYVFLTKAQFFKKLKNGDFIEFTEYNNNYYAISRFSDYTRNNIFIVEPVWRAALKKYFLQNNIPFKSYFVDISKEEAKERMMGRWDSVKTIEQRLGDFKYFTLEAWDYELDGRLEIRKNVKHIARSVWVS